MRYALKFGYHGKDFSGYARQPGQRTIEGEIIKALRETKMIDNEKSAGFQSASRTDKGVSAVGNVIALDTDFRKNEILPALNAHLEEIWFYGMAEVPPTFNLRHAKGRWYRYHVFDEGQGRKKIEECAKIFLGAHDFSNFTRMEGKDSKRTIDAIEISKENEFIVLDFKAQSFLWHMVRRIVSAIMYAAKGKLSPDDIKNALLAKQKGDFGIAPPEPLILMDVDYDFEFDVDVMNLKRSKITLEKHLRTLRIEGIIYHQMLRIADE